MCGTPLVVPKSTDDVPECQESLVNRHGLLESLSCRIALLYTLAACKVNKVELGALGAPSGNSMILHTINQHQQQCIVSQIITENNK